MPLRTAFRPPPPPTPPPAVGLVAAAVVPLTLASAAAAGVTPPAPAEPFTETFTTGPANWFGNNPTVDFEYQPAGGPDGSGFIQTTIDANSVGDQGLVVFRGQGDLGASGLQFTGDYLAGGIAEITMDVRHDAGADLGFFLRMTEPVPFPGLIVFSDNTIPSGQWTELSFTLDINAMNYVAEVQDPAQFPQVFTDVLSNVFNLQLAVRPLPEDLDAELLTFGLDNVRIDVPSPGAGMLALLAAPAVLRRRRG